MDLATIPWAPMSGVGLAFVLVGLTLRGYIIPRRIYLDLKQERDEWRAIARQLMNVTGNAVDAAGTTAHVLESLPAPEVAP